MVAKCSETVWFGEIANRASMRSYCGLRICRRLERDGPWDPGVLHGLSVVLCWARS